MTLSVQDALKVVATHASGDVTREALCHVRVEPTRCWATDGHRALLLDVVAPPEAVGDYKDGQKVIGGAQMPNIDQILPKAEPPIALELNEKTVQALRDAAWMVNQWTAAHVRFQTQGPTQLCLSRSNTGKGKKADRSASVTLLLEDSPITRAHEVAINLHYLLEAIDAVEANPKDVVLRQSSKSDPILIKGRHGFAIVMPCR